MKKKFCVVLCVTFIIACVFGLVACAPNNENDKPPIDSGNIDNIESYTPTEGLKYAIKDSYYIVTSRGTATETEIAVASTYNGKPVKSIGESAFAFNDITKVTIPNSITKIDKWAFTNSALTSITIPDSVTNIGFGAFEYCASLTSATIGKGVTSVGANTFANCKKLDNVSISEGLKYIGDCMFQDCISLKNLTIPNSVNSIGFLAFSSCKNLNSITIPKSVTRIGTGAFSGCNNFTVYFAGSEEDWNKIDISSGNNELLNAPRHYNSVGNENNDDNNNNNDNNDDNSSPTTQKHTLTYDFNYTGMSTITQQIAKDEDVNLIVPNRPGYEFLGWFYLGNKIESGVWQYDNDITLTAKWQAIKYSITYNTDGGIMPNDYLQSYTVVTSNLPYTLPVPTKQDYNFVGWYENDNFSGEQITTITKTSLQNYTLYAKYTNEQPLEFELSFDETYYSVIGYKGNPQYITVPQMYDGLPVKEITTKAFSGCKTLISITLPSSICKIGSSAFYNCSSLTSITIPNNVTSIGDNAFYECCSLTDITIPDSVTSIGNGAFMYCHSLTSIVIPDSVTSIAHMAFYNCGSLTSITIPDSVISIDSRAFDDCSKLTSIIIPDSVMSIGSSAFPDNLRKRYSGCYYLPTKDSEYGFLYDVISTDIVNVKIHDDCKIINDSAFSDCSSLTGIIIPDGVTSIGDKAFCRCSSLISIIIPDSATSIGNKAFYECHNLTNVFYKGSANDWKNIQFGDDNHCITYEKIIYYFTEDEPTDDGNYWHYDTDGKIPIIWKKDN